MHTSVAHMEWCTTGQLYLQLICGGSLVHHIRVLIAQRAGLVLKFI